MRFQIQHTTTYRYSQPVFLQPHQIRLRPRVDAVQSLQSFSIQVWPQPTLISQILDAEGNVVQNVRFSEQVTESLTVITASHLETSCENPFNYVLEPWATHLPINYPMRLMAALHPYLGLAGSSGLSSELIQLAYSIQAEVGGNAALFASTLNQRIYQTCQYLIRETGDPWPSAITWAKQQGSCRDLSLIFIDLCRLVGLAARFVSGYQAGDPDSTERYLHAWAEVYLPGGGWRGYDPTLGLAVADGHVAVMACALPQDAAPITGGFKSVNPAQVATATLDFGLTIHTSDHTSA